jgi:hypothetical protein
VEGGGLPFAGLVFAFVFCQVMVSAVESRLWPSDVDVEGGGEEVGVSFFEYWVRMLWLRTTSSSAAPAATAARASCNLSYVSCVPSWKPTTQATTTGEPLRLVTQRDTQWRRTQTLWNMLERMIKKQNSRCHRKS